MWKPGMCILLTSEEMYIVLFPFCNEKQVPLVNAISLNANLEQGLKLLAIIADHSFNPQMVLGDYLPIEKRLCFEIETYERARLKELEDELMMVKKVNKQLEEVTKLKCKIIPVEISFVSVKVFNNYYVHYFLDV